MNSDECEAWVRAAITKACRNPAEDVGPNEDLQSAIGLNSRKAGGACGDRGRIRLPFR